MTLTTAQLDRAVGALLGTAAGDALGGLYEFGPPRGPELEVVMAGGGDFRWEPGEWTDDTSMAIAIAEVAASGADLRDGKAPWTTQTGPVVCAKASSPKARARPAKRVTKASLKMSRSSGQP